MTALTKEQLLTPVPMELEEVKIPQLGGSVWVKGMTVSERTRFENNLRGKNEQAGKIKAQQVRERLLVQCVVTEDGTRMFSLDDVEKLGQQRSDVLEPLIDVVQSLCGMSNTDVERTAKNSEATQESSSS